MSRQSDNVLDIGMVWPMMLPAFSPPCESLKSPSRSPPIIVLDQFSLSEFMLARARDGSELLICVFDGEGRFQNWNGRPVRVRERVRK